MKFLLLIIFMVLHPLKKKGECYCSYNTCALGQDNKRVSKISNLTIIRYQSVNNKNIERDTLSEYFLVKKSRDTFNLITLFNIATSDSLIQEYRFSNTWNFRQLRDTCINFKSQFQLEKEIDTRYPVLFGTFFVEED